MKRTAIITGGTKGLGREITLAFARAGYQVLAFYSSDHAAAREVDAALAEMGATGRTLCHDAGSDNPAVWDCPEIRDAESLILVHNACAAFTPAPMHQLRWQDFERQLSVAVKGAWTCSQAVLRHMLKKGRGTIVTLSTSALEGPPPKGFTAYLTAKYALHGLTLALAAEYSPRGLKIFSVSPGYMETPLTRSWDARLQDAVRSNASRITVPMEAARQIVALTETPDTPGRGENHPI